MITVVEPQVAARWQTAAMDPRTSVIVVGHAKVPALSASHAVQEYFTVSLRVDRATGVVTEVDSTAVTGLVRGWLAEVLLGVDLGGDITAALTEIEQAYLGHAAGAIRQATHDAWRRFASYRSK
ncbi:DUF3870 domain-containing protein [Pseudonocardia sp. GCM10023141]|uniref:DUF3870 domain-containing protein n=1 Tax=Pseudonocardia sp. GCM10023141 TaxID=3252653 RepID=UPI003615E905